MYMEITITVYISQYHTVACFYNGASLQGRVWWDYISLPLTPLLVFANLLLHLPTVVLFRGRESVMSPKQMATHREGIFENDVISSTRNNTIKYVLLYGHLFKTILTFYSGNNRTNLLWILAKPFSPLPFPFLSFYVLIYQHIHIWVKQELK